MEWIEGIKLTNVQKVKEAGFDSRHIIEVGVQCSLRQLLDYGYFHADPHPGNLLVMEDGKLAYLDFGMMSEVSSEQRFGLIEAIVHLVNRDFAALSKDYVRLGFLTEDIDFSAIVPALSEVFNPHEGQSLTQMDFKDMTDQLSQIMYDYPFQVPAYYALIKVYPKTKHNVVKLGLITLYFGFIKEFSASELKRIKTLTLKWVEVS